MMLKNREKATYQRIASAKKAIKIVSGFMETRFNNLLAVQTIAFHYYPELKTNEIKNFWHFRLVSDDILTKMEKVLEQINTEQ